MKASLIPAAVLLVLVGAAAWLHAKPGGVRVSRREKDQISGIALFSERAEGSCATYHCGVFNPANKCQCNAACADFDSCCSDFKEECVEKKHHGKPSHPKVKKPVDYDADMMWQTSLMRNAMKQQQSLATGKELTRTDQEEHLEAAEKAMLARQEAQVPTANDTKMPTAQEIRERREREEERKKHHKEVANLTNFTSRWHSVGRSSFLDSLSDLLGGSRKEEQELKKSAEKVVLKREFREKKEAEEQKKEQEKKEKEEAKKKKEKEASKKKLDKEKKEIMQWKKDEKNVPNVTLYCFSLMMPFGYEPGLLFEQKKRGVGVFACNEHVVFSNVTTLMSGAPSPIKLHLMEGTLAVPYGGRWMTALNAGVFNKLWMEVIRLQRFRYHDWSVKVDPDAVFFADRLRQILRHKAPYKEIPQHTPEPTNADKCRTCQLEGHAHESCAAHVRWWQQQGRTCPEALKLTARAPPSDCGCECDDFACDLPDSNVYLNNCKWGLHGPIEVLSRRAVATFAAGLPRCVSLLTHPWGEDKFLDQCLQLLGVNRDNEYALLSETACGEQPAPCGTANVAFHPFKSIQSYFTCYAYADKYGHGPAIMPTWEDYQAGMGKDEDEDDD